MATRIEVTAEDIAAGVPNNCALCPIAKAATRAFGFPVSAKLHGLYRGRVHLHPILAAAAHFIARFDSFVTVEPFAFEV